jgi:peptidoglycan/LPS O-acetylase OafA/YrhL
MTHASISAPPTISQLAAHALLLHGVLGYASLSAGAWYVAIDFQLYALMTLLLWVSGTLAPRRAAPWILPGLVVLVSALSLLVVNRDAAWDDWAPYFFGSYGLGAMAWWARDLRRSPATAKLLLGAILLPAIVALTIDFRSRIAVAVVLACALVIINRSTTGNAWNQHRKLKWIDQLGKLSYSIFLIHFPICLLVNALFNHFVPAEPLWQGLGMLTAWIGSLLAGALFHQWIELPLGQLSRFMHQHAHPAPAIR